MTKQERIAVGHRLRQQRALLGLTREQFAELADIGAGYYGQIEVGTSQMSIDTLIKVSRTSRLSMEYILFGEEQDRPADQTSLQALLDRCSPRELRLAKRSCSCSCCAATCKNKKARFPETAVLTSARAITGRSRWAPPRCPLIR